MRLVLKQFGGIASLTALETIRQPIALLLTTAAFFLMAILPLVVSHTLGESAKMMADSALAVHFLFGLLLGGFAACHSLSGEIRGGTAATVLSKPVSREVFYLAKFAGIAGVMLLFSAGCTAAGLLSVRTVFEPYRADAWAAVPFLVAIFGAHAVAGLVNYFTRRPYVSDAFRFLLAGVFIAFLVAGFLGNKGNTLAFGPHYLWRLVPPSALIAAAVLILTAFSLALATRLEIVPTVSIASALFILGLMSDYLFGRHVGASRAAALIYAILPNWQHFWLADTLHLEEPVPLSYIGRALAYAAFYLLGLLGVGIVSFRHTEVKA